MTLTDERITVTHAMMVAANMTRGDQYGIPSDPLNPGKGLIWKDRFRLRDEDYDAIEEYFLNKANR